MGVTAGQSYTFDASPYLKDATAYTVQVEAQPTYQDLSLIHISLMEEYMQYMDEALALRDNLAAATGYDKTQQGGTSQSAKAVSYTHLNMGMMTTTCLTAS